MIYALSLTLRNTVYEITLNKCSKMEIFEKKNLITHVDMPFFFKPHYEIYKKVWNTTGHEKSQRGMKDAKWFPLNENRMKNRW